VFKLPPPQRLLKNMKFEGIEIALEGIWYEDNRWKSARGWGEGKEKLAEASARFMSQYGVKPGGGETRADSRAVWQNGSVGYELFMSTKAQFILALRSRKTCCAVCGSQTTDIFSQVAFNNITELHTYNAQNSMIIVTFFFGFIYFKLLMYFTMNVCFNIGYWKLQDFWCWS
jgi:hypothetical protein